MISHNPMKKVYICGDSFGCPEIGWSIDPWPVLLSKKLGTEYTVTNLSIACSSNLLIRMQVDKAISAQADFVILLCTTCTRNQGQVQTVKHKHSDIYERFVRVGQFDPDSAGRDLACYSLRSLDETCVFTKDDMDHIRGYHSRLFDLDLAIYENQCIIESSLHTLKQKGISFVFDQGGFENPMFGDVKKIDYFAEFDSHKSAINQWNLSGALSKTNRAHFHITDPDIHFQIADYYHKKIIDIDRS